MTTTTNQTLGRLTPHQREVAMRALRMLAAGDDRRVAAARRSWHRSARMSMRYIGSEIGLLHVAEKGYIVADEQMIDQHSTTFGTPFAAVPYRATAAGLEWFARQAGA